MLRRQTTRAAGLALAVTTAASLLLTFFQQIVIAKIFGAGQLTDAYLIGQIVPIILGCQFTLTLSSVATPLLAESEIRGGAAKQRKVYNILLAGACAATLTTSILCALGSRQVIGLLGSGLDAASLRTARNLLLLMLPGYMLVTLAGLPRAALHLSQNFILPSVAALFLQLGIISAALLLARRLGIYSLAIGAVAGILVMFVILFLSLSPFQRPEPSESVPWVPVIAAAGKSVVPVFICLSATQVYLVVGRSFAAGLAPGSVAALGFAASIMSIPIQLFSTTLGAIIFPRASKLAVMKKNLETGELTSRGLRLALFSVAPFVILFLLFPTEIVRYTLQRGAFSVVDTRRTASVLAGFAGGLPGIALSQVAMYTMIAISEYATAATASALTMLLDLPITYFLRAHWGAPGVAIGVSVVGSLNAAFLLVLIQRRVGRFGQGEWVGAMWRLAVCTLSAAAASGVIHQIFGRAAGAAHYWGGLVALMASLLGGLFAFAGCGLVLRSREVREILLAVRESRQLLGAIGG